MLHDKLQASADVFTRNTMTLLKTLHPSERRDYLAFLLYSVGEQSWADPFREMLAKITEIEGQIELWSTGQQRLNLSTD